MSIDEVQRCRALAEDPELRDKVNVGELQILRVLLDRFVECLNGLQLTDSKDLTLSGEYIFAFFESVGIQSDNVQTLIKIGDNITTVLSQGNTLFNKSLICL